MKQLVAEPHRVAVGPVMFLSAALAGYVVCVARSLALASWSHFAFAATVLALSGWGVGALTLDLWRNRPVHRLRLVLAATAFLAALLMPLALGVAMRLPVSMRIPPAGVDRWAVMWLLLSGVIGLPLLVAGAGFSAAILLAGPAISGLVAAGLAGAALGLTVTITLLNFLTPPLLMLGAALAGLLGFAGLISASAARRVGGLVVGLILCAAIGYCFPPIIRIDVDKYWARRARTLDEEAERWLATRLSPQAIVEFYAPAASPAPGAGLQATVNSAGVEWLADDHFGGRFGRISRDGASSDRGARLLELAWPLAPPEAQVLLLGVSSSGAIWHAHRHQATSIDVVHPLGILPQELQGPLAEAGGGALEIPNVRAHAAAPRHYVERFREEFDLVQIDLTVQPPDGAVADVNFGPDFLLTVEGLAVALRALREGGVLAAACDDEPTGRPVRLLATLAKALELRGVREPGRHIVVLRDAATIYVLAKEEPLTAGEHRALAGAARTLGAEACWLPEFDEREAAVPRALEDEIAAAAARLLSPGDANERARADVPAPPTDDRPFFENLVRPWSAWSIKGDVQPGWVLPRTHAVVLIAGAGGVVLLTAAIALAFGTALAARPRKIRTCLLIAGYFAAVAFACVFISLSFWPKLTLLIGDSKVAIVVAGAAFLAAAALGSVSAGRTLCAGERRLGLLVFGIIVTALVGYLIAGLGAPQAAGWPVWSRAAIGALLFAPVAYLLGFAAPAAFARIERAAPQLLPWSAAAGGLAAVLAIPLGMTAAMCLGFIVLGGIALLLAIVAAVLFPYLPEEI